MLTILRIVQTGDIKASRGIESQRHTQTYSRKSRPNLCTRVELWSSLLEGQLVITIAANIGGRRLFNQTCSSPRFPDSVVGFIADESKCDVRLHRRVHFPASAKPHATNTRTLGLAAYKTILIFKRLDRLTFLIPPLAGAAGHCSCAGDAGRQDRAEPAYE